MERERTFTAVSLAGSIRWVRCAAGVLLAAMSVSAHAQQDSLTRVTTFTYNATTGLLETERVDPDGSHCVETAYQHDEYGNRQRVTVQPCGSATSTRRITVNEFSPGTNHPAGAYLTRSRSGTEAGAGINAMAESKATFNAKFGMAASATEVAVGVVNGTRDLTQRTTYDPHGRVLGQHIPVKRNADNSVAETRVDYQTVYCRGPKASGNSACMTSLHDQTVPVTYASQRLVDTTGAVTDTATIMFRTAYFVEAAPRDGAGNVIGTRSRIHYDSLHREIAKETETYDGWTRSLTGYDQLGMVAATWGPQFFLQGVGLLPTDQRQWTTQRDLLHRSIAAKQMHRASGGANATEIESRVEYNGLTTTSIVPSGSSPNGERRRITRKNAVGQVAQTQDALGATLNMAYDAFGNLLQTLDALGFATTISYTSTTARFKASMTDPDKGTWQYSYDALGQLKTQADGRGKTTTLSYDALGRMTAKNTDELNASWKYSVGDSGVVQCADGLPRLCESWTGNLPTQVTRRQLGYDNLGRASQSTETLDRAYVSSTGFDDLGRVQTYTYPSGLALRYTYSTGASPANKKPGFLVTVADNANAAREFWSIANVTGNAFDARGNLLKARLGNGVTLDHGYDAISGKALALRAGAGGSTDNVLNQSYTYDKANNLALRSNGFNGGSESFGYDRLDRLTSYAVASPEAAANRTITVGYNAIGNILAKSDVAGGYYYAAARPHAVTWAAGNSYSYDANGNLLASSGTHTRTHTWTDFNLPRTSTYDGASVAFQYDDQYKRVKETFIAGGVERRLWLLHPDNAGGLAFEREETWSAGAITKNENRHYIGVGGAVIGVVKTLNANTSGATLVGTVSTDANLTLYWHKDSLGSIVAVSNGAGNVIERPAFDAWGRRLLENRLADNSAGGPAHGDRGYTGHEHLDELRLVHMNGRIYDPVLARFLSPDPLLQSPHDLQNYNAYSYVLNNPLRYTDPNGKWVVEAILFVVGAILAHEGNEYWSMAGRILMIYALQGEGGLVEAGLGDAANAANVFNAGGVGNAFASGATSAAAGGGNTEDIATSAIFAAAFYGAGELGGAAGQLTPQQLVAHMLIGCVQQSMGGGSCGPGALSAGFGKLTTANLPADFGALERGVATAIAGGTASVIGGGKFANGAFEGAFGYLFNAMTEEARRRYYERLGWIDREGNPLPMDIKATRASMAALTDIASSAFAVGATACAIAEPCGAAAAAGFAAIGATMGVANAAIERAPVGWTIDEIISRIGQSIGRLLGGWAPVATSVISEGVKKSPELGAFKKQADQQLRRDDGRQ